MTVTTNDLTSAYIIRAGDKMQRAAAEIVARGVYSVGDLADLAVAIVADFHGGTFQATLATDRAIKTIRRDLNQLMHADLVSTVERMANGTPEDAAWTYGFYALV